MLVKITACKKSCMYRRVQSLYSAVKTFRKTGNVADVDRIESCLSKGFFRTARRDNLETEFGQFLRELYYSRFVAYTYKRASFSHTFILLKKIILLLSFKALSQEMVE